MKVLSFVALDLFGRLLLSLDILFYIDIKSINMVSQTKPSINNFDNPYLIVLKFAIF